LQQPGQGPKGRSLRPEGWTASALDVAHPKGKKKERRPEGPKVEAGVLGEGQQAPSPLARVNEFSVLVYWKRPLLNKKCQLRMTAVSLFGVFITSAPMRVLSQQAFCTLM